MIVVVFFLVYLGMILGGPPFLQLDRTGVALLGAIVLIGVEALTPEQAAKSGAFPHGRIARPLRVRTPSRLRRFISGLPRRERAEAAPCGDFRLGQDRHLRQ